jgi:Ca-activated chloride channel family protein
LAKFEHSWYLLFLALAPVPLFLFIYVSRWKKRAISRIGDPGLVKMLIAGYSPERYRLKFLLLLSAFILMVLGLANPQYPGQTQPVRRTGLDVMLVLDVSKSMLARDIQPTRLDRARQLMKKLIDELDGNRVGLVLFAGRAYLQMPLTTDHATAKSYISMASPASVPAQGTVISEALYVGLNAFGRKDKKYKAVVLITDGEDHEEEAEKLAEMLSENGVPLHVIGMGSAEGAPINDPDTDLQKLDAMGNVVISRLNEPMLQKLAQAANGSYRRFDDTETAVGGILATFAEMEKKDYIEPSSINYRSFFQWFMAAALCLLVIEYFISERKPVTL